MRATSRYFFYLTLTGILLCGACQGDDDVGIGPMPPPPEEPPMEPPVPELDYLIIDTTDTNPSVTIIDTDIQIGGIGGTETLRVMLGDYEFYLDVSSFYWGTQGGSVDKGASLSELGEGIMIHSVEKVDSIVSYTIYNNQLELDCHHRYNYRPDLDLSNAENIEFEEVTSNQPFSLALGDTLFANSPFQDVPEYKLLEGYSFSYYSTNEGSEGCTTVSWTLGNWRWQHPEISRFCGFKFTHNEQTYLGWIETSMTARIVMRIAYAPVRD